MPIKDTSDVVKTPGADDVIVTPEADPSGAGSPVAPRIRGKYQIAYGAAGLGNGRPRGHVQHFVGVVESIYTNNRNHPDEWAQIRLIAGEARAISGAVRQPGELFSIYLAHALFFPVTPDKAEADR